MLARKSLVVVGGNVLGGILGLIALKLVALYFGTDPLGEVLFATALVGMAYVIQELGFTQAHIKFVSEGRDVSTCMTTFFVLKTLLTILFVLTILGGLFVHTVLLGKELYSTTYAAVFIMLGTNVVTSIRAVNRFTLEARQETAKGQALTLLETATRVLLTGVFAVTLAMGTLPLFDTAALDAWVHAHATEALALTYLAGAIASTAYGFYATKDLPWGKFDKDLARQYARFAFPFMVLNLVGVASTYIDSFAVGYFWNETEVGLLGGAQRIVLLISMVPTAVGTLLFPHISGLHAGDQREHIREVFENTLRYIGFIVLPMTVFVVAYADPIIRILLAASFQGSANVLIALTLNTLLVALTTPYVALVTGMNRPSAAAKVGVLTGILVVGLNLLLIPTSILGIPLFGLKAFGAALGTAFASLVGFILLRLVAYRLVGVGGAWWHLVRQVLASLFMYAALMGLAALIPEFGRWYHLAFAGVAGGLVYLLTLILLRELTMKDWRFFLDLANPAPTLRYLKEELRGR
ncbi:MAG TPA: flippase [Candidatus Thermoplasmatota archaeon]|nr:flippase [Candidatus Thermoplasmatota archaeon]